MIRPLSTFVAHQEFWIRTFEADAMDCQTKGGSLCAKIPRVP
jgi:hypothetical protein